MSRAHKLDTTLGNGAGCLGFKLRANLINDNHLGHVVFHRLNHDSVLHGRGCDLHPAGVTDGGVGDVAITGNLVGGIDNNNTLLKIVGENTCYLTKHGRLTHSWTPQKQNALPCPDQVFNNPDCAEDSPSHTAGEPDNLPFAVADSRNAVKGAGDTRPVIPAEAPHVGGDVLNVLLTHISRV